MSHPADPQAFGYLTRATDMSREFKLQIAASMLIPILGIATIAQAQNECLTGVPGAAQPQEQTLRESALLRARTAAALRDSILRYNPNGGGGALTIPEPIENFLRDPYNQNPVSLDSLDRCLAGVNFRLARQRTNENDGVSVRGIGPQEVAAIAGTSADLAGGSSGLSTLNLAVGLTDFLIERGKDEAVLSFMLTMKRNVSTDALITTALPRSHAIIMRLETENFQSLMPVLRTAFVEDLNELPTRGGRIATALNLSSAERSYLEGIGIVYSRGMEMRRGAPPAVALSNLVEVSRSDLSDTLALRSLHVIGLLAREYAAGGGEEVIRELTGPAGGWLRRYFVAFVARDVVNLDQIQGVDATNFLRLLSQRESDALLLLNQLHSVRDALASTTAEGGNPGGTGQANGWTAAVAVLEVLRTAPRFLYAPGEDQGSFQKLDSILTDASHLHHAFVRQDYGAIITWLLENPHVTMCGTISNSTCNVRLRYLSLAASLAAATSSDEVAQALRTASAPVGSYRAKRAQHGEWLRPLTIAATGYLGAAAYHQNASDGTEAPQSAGGYVGVGLPFGLELSAGAPWGALSVYFPLLDLGSLANSALGLASDTADSADFQPQNVVAPGVAVVFNLTRNFPVSFGLGVQSVRQVHTTAAGTTARRNARTMIFLGVDATLFQFKL